MSESTYMGEERLRGELIEVCGRLQRRGLIAATDGNVSARLDDERLLVTPSGSAKGDLKAEDLLITDMDGNKISGNGRPSSEIRMHLAVYRRRPDVRALVHAHPAILTAFTLAGIPFQGAVLPEVWLTVGEVPTAPYATPSTDEVPASIEPFVETANAVLLERHGSLTFGKTLMQAYLRLEKLEHAAMVLMHAHTLLGHAPTPLSPDEKRRLEAAFGALK